MSVLLAQCSCLSGPLWKHCLFVVAAENSQQAMGETWRAEVAIRDRLYCGPTSTPKFTIFQEHKCVALCEGVALRKLGSPVLGLGKQEACLTFTPPPAPPPTESSLQVNLMSRQPQVSLTHTFDLSCIVRANYSDLKLPFSVTWQFQPAGSGAFQQLIRVTHNGTVEWGDVLSQFHRKTKVSQSSFRSQLQIHDAALEETGVYQCKVEVYDRKSLYTSGPPRVSATSNLLRIAVTFPGKGCSKLIPALKKKKKRIFFGGSGMMVLTYNPSTQEAETGGLRI